MNNFAEVYKKLANEVAGVLKRLPRKLGVEVVRYSGQRFREQGWDGRPWPKRRPKRRPGAKNNNGRAILVKTGRLRRSVRITGITEDSVTVGTDVPYARIHNEGYKGSQQVRAHSRRLKFEAKYTDLTEKTKSGKFKVRKAKGVYETKVEAFTRRMRMPRRQFLGDSPYLQRNLKRIADAEFNRACKAFNR